MTPETARECLTRGGRRTTDDEVKRFVEEYKAGIPVMPVTFVCAFLREWAGVYGDRLKYKDTDPDELKQNLKVVENFYNTFTQISKSNLLWRRIYAGEELRTEPCPVHKGHWSGCRLPEDTECKGACMDGHNVTGWLPVKEEKKDA